MTGTLSFHPPHLATADDELLAGLNAAQRQAVTHGSGPLLIVAGAGTGKTTTLTHRVAWMIHSGVDSRRSPTWPTRSNFRIPATGQRGTLEPEMSRDQHPNQ